MLLDMQNRGQLAAGMTSYHPNHNQLIDTYKDVGTVNEVFRLNHRAKFNSIMDEYAGRAAIGHVRYATCGQDDRSYAQPFERHHIRKHKWFSFAFNGQLANYAALRDELLQDRNNHLSRETDTELIMHVLCKALAHRDSPPLIEVCREIAQRFDGAYSLVFMNALGDMVVARDPLGMKPLCYAKDGPLFAAASESVALLNLGFPEKSIRSLEPGEAIIIQDGVLSHERFADRVEHAHCFFEWIYFANVASTLDDRSVYLARKSLGEELAQNINLEIDDNTIIVPVPDTSKAAADALAYALHIPSVEGLIRNRYTGRTFIEGGSDRAKKAQHKYTPLRQVMEGKRVILVEDSIVRSTTMKVLLKRIREQAKPKEIHVRVACPPIISPCYYGIDMSTFDELFAPRFLKGGPLTDEIQDQMAAELGADSLRYLPVEAISRAIGVPATHLCQACIDGVYPTPCGREISKEARANYEKGVVTSKRAFDAPKVC
jgi:amidophosphoribosyltransferase